MAMTEDTRKMVIGFGAIVGLGLIISIGGSIRDQMARSDVRRYAEARNWEVKTDPTTGSLMCGSNRKQVPLDTPETFSFCGETFISSEKFGELIEKANELMEAEYEAYPKAKEELERKKAKAGFLKKRKLEASFAWKWKGYIARKMEAIAILGDSNAMKCIRVTSGGRYTPHQYYIFMDSLTEEGKERWDKGLPIRKQDQTYTAAVPCRSFHETMRAVDVGNWLAAQHYLWKVGLSGGSRGLYKDPYHFSKGEFANQGAGRATANKEWYVRCKRLGSKCGQ